MVLLLCMIRRLTVGKVAIRAKTTILSDERLSEWLLRPKVAVLDRLVANKHDSNRYGLKKCQSARI